MSAYGDVLGAFPELFQSFETYSAVPKVGGGYDMKAHGAVSCIVQTDGSFLNVRDNYARNARSTGSAAGIVATVEQYTLWSRTRLSLVDLFLKIGDDYFRPTGAETWDLEAGFFRQEVHKVVGTVVAEVTHKLTVGAFE